MVAAIWARALIDHLDDLLDLTRCHLVQALLHEISLVDQAGKLFKVNHATPNAFCIRPYLFSFSASFGRLVMVSPKTISTAVELVRYGGMLGQNIFASTLYQ